MTTSKAFKIEDQPSPLATSIILGVGTDGQLYAKLDYGSIWRKVQDDSNGNLKSIAVGDGDVNIHTVKLLRLTCEKIRSISLAAKNHI